MPLVFNIYIYIYICNHSHYTLRLNLNYCVTGVLVFKFLKAFTDFISISFLIKNTVQRDNDFCQIHKTRKINNIKW